MMMLLHTVLVLVMIMLIVLTQVCEEMAPAMLLEVQGAPVVAPVRGPMAPGAPVVAPIQEPVAPGAQLYEGLADRPSFVVDPPVYRGRCWTDQLGWVDRFWVQGPGEVLLPMMKHLM